MPVRVEQPRDMGAGHANLTVTSGTELDPASLEVSLSGTVNGVQKHLDPNGGDAHPWVSGARWFKPLSASQEGGVLRLGLGPAVTWRLRPHTPYKISLRDASGQSAEDRMTWTAIRLPSTPPTEVPELAASDPLAAFEGPVEEASAKTAPEPEEEPEKKLEPEEELKPKPEPEKQPERRSQAWLFLLLGLLVLGAAGGAAYYYLYMMPEKPDVIEPEPEPESAPELEPEPEPAPKSTPDEPVPVTPAQSVPTTRAGAQNFIKSGPSVDDAKAQAERFLAANEAGGAFLILKYAASKGDADSAKTIGRWYDPGTPDNERGPFSKANSNAAARNYEQAAKLGDVEAMRRLGLLYKDGAIDVPDAVERAQHWLQRAADAGDELAKEALQ